MKKISLGIDEYKIVKKECYYVDKTMIIKDIIDKPSNSIILFTRPRRFGKTLTLSMLDTFFRKTNDDLTSYFYDTKIYCYNDIVNEYMGKYDIIHISFKDIEADNYKDIVLKVKQTIIRELNKFNDLYEQLPEVDKKILAKYSDENCDDVLFTSCLLDYSACIHKVTDKRIIIIIDEYDVPMHVSYEKGFFEQSVLFFKRLYSETFKGNNNIQYAILTGATKAEQASLFSGFNNALVNTVLDNQYNEYFGFNEQETKELLNYYGLSNTFDKVNEYYGGYHFGNGTFLNPWSVLKYCQTNGQLKTFWTATASPTLLGKLVKDNYVNIAEELRLLNENKAILINIDENVDYYHASTNRETVLSFLVFLGYLTATYYNDEYYEVSIVNKETAIILNNQLKNVLFPKDNMNLLLSLKRSFMEGDEILFNQLLEQSLLSSLSYFDFNNEKNYQIRLVTLFSLIFDDSIVNSEVIAGDGRCDIMIVPKNGGNFAAVIELKYLQHRTSIERLGLSSNKALKQIEQHNYCQSLMNRDIDCLYGYGIAFYKNKAHTSKLRIK